MEKVRLGVVGPGIIWEEVHKPVLKQLDDMFDIGAFSASSEKSRKKINIEFPGLPFFKDYNELLKSDLIDTALVLTPINMSAEVSIAAMDRGKDVITEKPMAATVAEGNRLIAKQKQSGKQVIILEQNIYKKSVDTCKDIIDSGNIGEVIYYDRLSCVIMDHKKDNSPDYAYTGWRIKPEFMLGLFFDAGIHDIAELGKIFGEPVSIFAEGTKYREDYGPYDHVVTILEYPGCLKGIFSFSSILSGKKNFFDIRGTKGLIRIEDRIVKIEYDDGKKEELTPDQKNVHLDMWHKIYHYLRGDKKPYYTTLLALKDIKTMEAIDRSLRKSQKVFMKDLMS